MGQSPQKMQSATSTASKCHFDMLEVELREVGEAQDYLIGRLLQHVAHPAGSEDGKPYTVEIEILHY